MPRRRVVSQSSWASQDKVKSDTAGLAEARARAFRASKNRETELDLSGLGLSIIPSEVFDCQRLKKLNLRNNHIINVPDQVSRLKELQTLQLDENDVETVSPKLSTLTKLQALTLSSNKLTSFPGPIAGLRKLRLLALADNQIGELPESIGELSSLTFLDVSRNGLRSLPVSLGRLASLESLIADSNGIHVVHSSIGSLANLAILDLSANALTGLPSEIERLSLLKTLDVRDNQLKEFPPEIGRIKGLTDLRIDPEGFENIPFDVIEQGTTGVMSYLRSLLDENAPVFPYQAKIVIVGQGNVGKTCLLNNLLGQPALDYSGKTEGVEIKQLRLPHPSVENQNMTLSVWDFGGQEIQHATHQFFLTTGSLFLLLWNSRQDAGKSGGNLQYWLEMIQARAPESPVFLVATHCDQEPLRTSVAYWQERFKNVKGVFEVGNIELKGIETLREAIRQEASQLPTMKDRWNRRWRDAKNAVKEVKQPYVSPEEVWDVMRKNKVEDDELEVVARRMHLLGDLVYIHDNPVLKDTVVLDAEWLTKHVCEAVSSDEVQRNLGVLTPAMMTRIWPRERKGTREELLNFMEQYDLSYRTQSVGSESIVVQALPDSPSTKLWDLWSEWGDQPSLQIRYRFRGTLPPGIPSWFIARAHRFTIGQHWRYGALFVDESGEHRALVQLSETAGDVNVLLAVRGPEPIQFFSVLQDGFEQTLKTYRGLDIQRKVPCRGTWCDEKPCRHEFGLEALHKYRKRGFDTIRCESSLEEYEVTELLYGLTLPREEVTLSAWKEIIDSLGSRLEAKLDQGTSKVESVLREILGFQQREFTKIFKTFQSQPATHSPSVFVIEEPPEGWEKAMSGKLKLRLCCEMPGCWHPVEEGGTYEIADPAHWLTKAAPYFRTLVKAFKVATPAIGALADYALPDLTKDFASTEKLSQELAKLLPDVKLDESLNADDHQMNKVVGVAYQALRELLAQQDPNLTKTGLEKVLTAERDYLWLCPTHAKEAISRLHTGRN